VVRASRLGHLAILASVALTACGEPSFDRRGGPGRGAGEPCNRAADCRQGLTCVDRTCAASVPVGSCPAEPRIVLADPLGPESPPPPLDDPPCALPVRAVAPNFPAASVQEKGPVPVGSVVTFDVPPGTTSLTIVTQEVDGTAVNEVTIRASGGGSLSLPNTVQPTQLVAPGPTTFYDDLAPIPFDASTLLAQYVGFQPSTGIMTIPNTSRALDLIRSTGGLPAGQWQFTLVDTASECKELDCTADHTNGVYDVKILTRAAPLEEAGALDLDVYFVSADPDASLPSVTARDATADPATNVTARNFQRFVSTVAGVFSRAGVCLGTVRVHEVPVWARTEFHDLDVDASGPCAPMARLFSLAAPERGVHVFMVDALVTANGPGGGAVIVGIDGSIPGPSALPGTLNSGTAVVLADFGRGTCDGAVDFGRCGTDRVAYIAAHEAGHWLGLYHVTESGGTFFDPLVDTATCPCDTCAPAAQRAQCAGGDVKLFSDSCSGAREGCGGGDNLMYWLVDPDVSTGALSPEQGEVIRANPAVGRIP
jgi:hypothetical protein